MAQKKRLLWVELEVRAERAGPGLNYRYLIFNPRLPKAPPIESSIPIFETEQQAIRWGLQYLRNTYNTGKRK